MADADGLSELKKLILNQLQKPAYECTIRLIFSSVALGMGADLQNVSRIIHAGPPSTLETYVQEIGRAGRSGTVAEAILYYNRADLGVQTMKKEMKDYCLNCNTCRRISINNHFGYNATNRPAICCDICTKELGFEWDFGKLALQ
ncbi:hypothetical protein ACF0H5_008603 [Mactra antiquata]